MPKTDVILLSDFPLHRKVKGVSVEARWLYICGLCYSLRNLTNGWLAPTAIFEWEPWLPEFVESCAVELCKVNLWEGEPKGGYKIHDWEHYTGKGQRKKTKKKKVIPVPEYSPEFEQFWALYPRQINKPAAWLEWCKIVEFSSPRALILAAEAYKDEVTERNTERWYIIQPKNFLSRGDWQEYAKVTTKQAAARSSNVWDESYRLWVEGSNGS